MNPIGITEQLMYTTVRLTTDNGGCGTGYFYSFDFGEINIPIIITNKHVVNNNPDETITFCLHLTDDGKIAKGNHCVRMSTHWFFHPTKDLCFAFCAGIDNQIPNITGKKVFRRTINSSMIWSKEKLKDLSMSESVIMIGYPNGLWDKAHNFPIFRYGYTAAHPAYDFNEDSIGLVDMACFPGSSGSPIFIINEGSVRDKKGNLYLGKNRMFFLGTLFAGPTINTEGIIGVRNIPTGVQQFISKTELMMNLGYYIKSYELEAFRPIILNELKEKADYEEMRRFFKAGGV